MAEADGNDIPDQQPGNQTSADNIRACRDVLIFIIDIECLLDELRSSHIITYQQIELIQCKVPVCCQVAQLLDDVIAMPPETREGFLTALEKTGQKHVSNYIRANGTRTTEYADDWPLFVTERMKEIDSNRSQLVDLVDCRNGLLDDMMQSRCISIQHRDTIDARKHEGTSQQNRILLKIICRKSLNDYKQFIKCLDGTNQKKAAYLLRSPSDAAENTCHLNEHKYGEFMLNNYKTLVLQIDTRHGLLEKMFSVGCITRLQREFIYEPESQSEKNRRLLDIIRRSCEASITEFIQCLDQTGQQHVSGIINGNAAKSSSTEKQKDDHNWLQLKIKFSNNCKECKDNILHNNNNADEREEIMQLCLSTFGCRIHKNKATSCVIL